MPRFTLLKPLRPQRTLGLLSHPISKMQRKIQGARYVNISILRPSPKVVIVPDRQINQKLNHLRVDCSAASLFAYSRRQKVER